MQSLLGTSTLPRCVPYVFRARRRRETIPGRSSSIVGSLILSWPTWKLPRPPPSTPTDQPHFPPPLSWIGKGGGSHFRRRSPKFVGRLVTLCTASFSRSVVSPIPPATAAAIVFACELRVACRRYIFDSQLGTPRERHWLALVYCCCPHATALLDISSSSSESHAMSQGTAPHTFPNAALALLFFFCRRQGTYVASSVRHIRRSRRRTSGDKLRFRKEGRKDVVRANNVAGRRAVARPPEAAAASFLIARPQTKYTAIARKEEEAAQPQQPAPA